MAKLQPYVFGIGVSIMSIGMTFMGSFGIPRRSWDSTGSSAPFQVDYHPAVSIIQAIFGIGGLVTGIGSLMFIIVAVTSVFFGKKFTKESADNGEKGIPQGIISLPKQVHSGAMVARIHKSGTPGTVILVYIFLACFVVYFFTNWKLLSFLWKIG